MNTLNKDARAIMRDLFVGFVIMVFSQLIGSEVLHDVYECCASNQGPMYGANLFLNKSSHCV